ncbi:MAG: right-handed parallel beta-helix repeat-containing protein [Deltaproteobacteria bacterium]|nr:right-handed parallel beta-helix repeat-containing protein [Deltaproteobacteria bacterium]
MILWLIGCPLLSDADLASRRDNDGDGHDSLQFGGDDCNDERGDVYPGAPDDWYDGVDADCAGNADYDQDGDGYDATVDDCNDSDAGIHPGAAETDCTDATDYDCDGVTLHADGDLDGVPECIDCDDADAAVGDGLYWYADADGDTYGNPDDVEYACAPTGDRVADDSDCDDARDDVHPGAAEYCGGTDHDCDGEANEDNSVDRVTFYADADADGHGNPDGPILACTAPPGFACNDTDCDDTDEAVNPGAPEWACNTIDDDCDGAEPSVSIRVPADYPEIQDAIAAAAEGDVICVDAGTYEENVEVYRAGITLEGAGPGLSIIDGDARHRAVTINYANGVTLRGFTLTNGAVYGGSGVAVDHGEDTLLEALDVSGNAAGGVSVYDGSATLRHVDIHENTAEGYSGEGTGLWVAASTVDAWRVRIVANEMRVSERCAGVGAYFQSSVITLDQVIVAANRCVATDDGAAAGGVGVHVEGATEVTISQSVLFANEADVGAATSDSSVNWYMEDGSDAVTVLNVVSAGALANDATPCGGWCGSADADWDIEYTDTWGNAGSAYDFTDPTGSDGNIAVDPMFLDTTAADPMDWDYTLAPGSPLIDAGDPSVLDVDCSTSDVGVAGGPNGSW